MKISKKLCITMDWTTEDLEVFQVGNFALDNYWVENADELQIPNFPVPDGIKNLIDPSMLLIFKRISKSKAKLVWVYSPKDSILYDTNGKRASKKDMRRFMQLMFSIWLNHC